MALMNAFRYSNAASGLQLQQVPVPDPGNDEVLIRVRAAGMCHSDCHILTGTRDGWLLKNPITLGHEVSGEITKVGHSVSGFRVGDRVAVFQLCQPAEERDWSLTVGLGFDGGYAEFAAIPTSRIKRIPEGVSFAHAAIAMDALATSYQAVISCPGVRPGMTIGVIGLGGLGMPGLAFGVIEGAKVYGFDLLHSKFEEATRRGATQCYKTVEEAKGVVFDVIIDFVGTNATVRSALSGVREGGKVILVGLASTDLSIPTDLLVLRSTTLVGSLGASEADCDRVLQLLQDGSIDPTLVEVPFEQISATLDIISKGPESEGRFWADPSRIVQT